MLHVKSAHPSHPHCSWQRETRQARPLLMVAQTHRAITPFAFCFTASDGLARNRASAPQS